MDTHGIELTADPLALALALVNIPSVSGQEKRLADVVEKLLRQYSHLEVTRQGDTIVARTQLGRPQRVVIAGHLDTVPISRHTNNVPGWIENQAGQTVLWGRGSVDMKAGVAAQLHLAATLKQPRYDLTWVFYDHEEVTGELNGLGRIMAARPDLIKGDFALLGEPTNASIEGGCNGTLRLILTIPGRAAHSGRAWRGVNAIHRAIPLLSHCSTAPIREVAVEGLLFKESFSAVKVAAGVANNTVPDECTITVNYRFAPDLTDAQALLRALQILAGVPEINLADSNSAVQLELKQLVERSGIRALIPDIKVELDDLSSASRPGLDTPLGAELLALVRQRGAEVGPKYGWTDVARFSAAGIPAVNLGPGDPMLAHTDDEHCPADQIQTVVELLTQWLT